MRREAEGAHVPGQPSHWSLWRPAWPLPKLALLLWLMLVLVVSSRTLVSPRTNSVYPIFASAARNWLAGNPLYRAPSDLYRYSPLVATLFVPFSLFSDPLGGALWRVLNAGVYLAALGWWCRVALPRALTAGQRA